MWKMPRIPHPPIVAAVIAVGEGVARIVKDLHEFKEQVMAKFDALEGKIDELGSALDNLETEWAELKDQLASDTADQAKVDELTARMDAAVSRVRGVDLVPDEAPADILATAFGYCGLLLSGLTLQLVGNLQQ